MYHITESLHCTSETDTTLLINYIPIEVKNEIKCVLKNYPNFMLNTE